MKIRFFSYSIFIFVLLISCVKVQDPQDFNQVLWYTYPAKYWNSQALHLGNGYFGASFFGGIQEETFALSEKSMWTGQPANGNWEEAGVNPNAMATIPRIRQAVLNGQSKLADQLIEENVFGSLDYYGNFTSIGDLKIRLDGQVGEVQNYVRKLDLKKAIGSVNYEIDGILYTREYFCSYPGRILALKFSSSQPEKISLDISVKVMQDSSLSGVGDNILTVRGYIKNNGRPFEVRILVKKDGGELVPDKKTLGVRNANSVELFITMATNYKMEYPAYTGEDPSLTTHNILTQIGNSGFEKLRAEHIKDYQSLYNRTIFEIPGDRNIESLPTNERFHRLRKGNSDPGYKELTFNLGRYLIISSSRPNTLPANLQGVWNAFKVAPWAGNYQSNINIQEIYWSCGPTNLLECQQPYIDWIENLAISGREVAKRVYGTDGWVSHTIGNIWGHAAPAGGHPWAMYPMGAAWHCQHVWEQYAFTRDTGYLADRGYPLLKDASIFWLENLVPFNGYYITAPTVSAEHGALMTEEGLNPAYHDFRSERYHYSLPGVYQDIQMMWDLFTNTAEAASILGDRSFADSLLRTREKLLPLKIGKHGQLQEWFEDIDDPGCHHRHIAHLYAVCPGREIHPTTTPELAAAAKKALDMRGDGRFMEQELASGGNWARAHRMWCWTRLLDGNRANKILTEMLTEQGFENGLTFQHANYHWEKKDFYMEDSLYLHFQLDGSASVPGCIAEMILQSHVGEIHLLPALPDEFRSGKMSGLLARGGYIVDLEWTEGELQAATIRCLSGKTVPSIRVKKDLATGDELKKIRIL